MSGEVDAEIGQSVARVLDELALGHLVLYGRTRQVDGEENEREAENVDGVFVEAELRVARAEAFRELLEQQRQVRVALAWCLDLREEAPQCRR